MATQLSNNDMLIDQLLAVEDPLAFWKSVREKLDEPHVVKLFGNLRAIVDTSPDDVKNSLKRKRDESATHAHRGFESEVHDRPVELVGHIPRFQVLGGSLLCFHPVFSFESSSHHRATCRRLLVDSQTVSTRVVHRVSLVLISKTQEDLLLPRVAR